MRLTGNARLGLATALATLGGCVTPRPVQPVETPRTPAIVEEALRVVLAFREGRHFGRIAQRFSDHAAACFAARHRRDR